MPGSCHIFSGAHETVDAAHIQKFGFTLPPVELGDDMFGAGIYFYADDAIGIDLARKWAELRANEHGLPLEAAQVLGVDVPYGDDNFFRWGVEEERQVYARLAEWQKISPAEPLTRRRQNIFRERVLAYIISQMPAGCAVVLAELPLPPNAGVLKTAHPRHQGCIVRDTSILPAPPYREEKYHAYQLTPEPRRGGGTGPVEEDVLRRHNGYPDNTGSPLP